MPDTDVVFTITPRARLEQVRQRVPAHQERAPQVDRDDAVEHRRVERLGPVELADPGDVAHHVQPAELHEREVDAAGDGLGVGDVALVAPGPATVGDDAGRGVVVALHVEAGDGRTFGREPPRRGPADPGTGAGHDGAGRRCVVAPCQTRSRSSNFSTLPLAFTGNASTTTTRARHLVVGHARRAPGAQLVGIDRRHPTAARRTPRRPHPCAASGALTTATCATSGCSRIAFSTSAG